MNLNLKMNDGQENIENGSKKTATAASLSNLKANKKSPKRTDGSGFADLSAYQEAS